MAPTEKKLEQTIGLIQALHQRFLDTANAAQVLQQPGRWRSLDGSLTLGSLTTEEKADLKKKITTNMDEAEMVIIAIRGLLE